MKIFVNPGNPDSGILEIFVCEIWNPGLWNPESGIRNRGQRIRNPESKFH